ncbi:MAG: OB-fold nucleic acid binding domain-containing protein, partial [Candidatus Aenigmarchaeota archaeon]|nr:OB-fold nucleic acid binding domain-containing protein [Candidatus Aenigmarchaeota archaeon]
MDDRHLRNVSLCLSLIGLFLLAVGVSLKEPRHVEVGSITYDMRGMSVSVTGTAISVTVSGENMFFKLVDETGTIKVVFFENDLVRQNIGVSDIVDGAKISLEGRVELYRGSLEIVAQRVT